MSRPVTVRLNDDLFDRLETAQDQRNFASRAELIRQILQGQASPLSTNEAGMDSEDESDATDVSTVLKRMASSLNTMNDRLGTIEEEVSTDETPGPQESGLGPRTYTPEDVPSLGIETRNTLSKQIGEELTDKWNLSDDQRRATVKAVMQMYQFLRENELADRALLWEEFGDELTPAFLPPGQDWFENIVRPMAELLPGVVVPDEDSDVCYYHPERQRAQQAAFKT